jgi:hypothetical protein
MKESYPSEQPQALKQSSDPTQPQAKPKVNLKANWKPLGAIRDSFAVQLDQDWDLARY